MEENNMNMETQNIEENTEEKGKTYTSEEVSSIVQKRLASFKKSVSKEVEAEYQVKLKELEDRSLDLEKREKEFTLRSALSERGMPKELANIISFTDTEDLNTKLEALNAIYGPKVNEKVTETEPTQKTGFQVIGGPDGDEIRSDSISEAFKYKGRI